MPLSKETKPNVQIDLFNSNYETISGATSSSQSYPGVMAMKNYSTLPGCPKLESHH